MCYLEAEVRPNEKDILIADLKEADYWVRKSNPSDKVYIENIDLGGFGWVEFIGTENGEWMGETCLLSMFKGCYKPMRIEHGNLDEELKDLRVLISKTESLVKKYPERFSINMSLQALKQREQRLLQKRSEHV